MHQKPSLENLVKITSAVTSRQIEQQIQQLESGYTRADLFQDQLADKAYGFLPHSDRTQQIAKLRQDLIDIKEFMHQTSTSNSN